MKDENKMYHDDLVEYAKELKSNKYYSHQRLDIIIVLVSTSGIFVLSNLLLTEHYQIAWLKIALLFFALAIILNILGQTFSAKSHSQLEIIYQKKIRDLREKDEINESEYEGQEKRLRTLSQFIEVFNASAIFMLLSAILISVISFLTTF